MREGAMGMRDPEEYMGIEKNCRAVRVEWWKWFEMVEAKKGELEMFNIESPWE